MSENWSSSLRLDLSLKNSGKSLVVVWKNLPTGGPLDTQTYPRVILKPPSEAGLLLGISLGLRPREIPRSSPASPQKTPSFPPLLLRLTQTVANVGGSGKDDGKEEDPQHISKVLQSKSE